MKCWFPGVWLKSIFTLVSSFIMQQCGFVSFWSCYFRERLLAIVFCFPSRFGAFWSSNVRNPARFNFCHIANDSRILISGQNSYLRLTLYGWIFARRLGLRSTFNQWHEAIDFHFQLTCAEFLPWSLRFFVPSNFNWFNLLFLWYSDFQPSLLLISYGKGSTFIPRLIKVHKIISAWGSIFLIYLVLTVY